MAITGAQLLAETQVLLSTSTSVIDPFWTDANLYSSITDALKWLWSLLPEKFLEGYIAKQTIDIVTGTAEYTVATDLYMLDSTYLNGYECRKKTYDELTRLLSNSFTKPTNFQPVCYLRSTFIGFSPTPDANSTGGGVCHYIQVSPTVDDAADSVSIADKFLPVISKRAAGLAKLYKESVQEGRELLDAATAELFSILGRRRALETEAAKPDRGEEKK